MLGVFIAAVSEVSLLTHNSSDIYSTTQFNRQQINRHSTLPSLTKSGLSGTSIGVIQRTDSRFGGSNESSIVFVETIPSVLRCIAIGGYPPPDLQLYVGRRDVTADFELTHVTRLVGTRGLRVMHHVTERWSHRFNVSAADDSSRITCVVSVTGLTTKICSRRLNAYRK